MAFASIHENICQIGTPFFEVLAAFSTDSDFMYYPAKKHIARRTY